MKKILLTLLITAGFFITAEAQNRVHRQRVIHERKQDRKELRRTRRIKQRHHRRRHHRTVFLTSPSAIYQPGIVLFKPRTITTG